MSEEKKEQPYIIVEGVTPTVLAAQVSNNMEKYTPYGDMSCLGNKFFQPMTLKEVDTKVYVDPKRILRS
jgi:hypothetical protein